MSRLKYRVQWNGEEWVATCPTILDVSGRSQLAPYALHALVLKLNELGFDTGPVSMKELEKGKGRRDHEDV